MKKGLNSEDFEKVSGEKMKAVEMKDGGSAMIDEDAIFETKKDAETAMNSLNLIITNNILCFLYFLTLKDLLGVPKTMINIFRIRQLNQLMAIPKIK